MRIATVALAAGTMCLASLPHQAAASPAHLAGGARSTLAADAADLHRIGHRHSRRIVRRHRHDDVEVDAPTTYVRTYRGYVVVEAPFTSVERSHRGVRVRAPFVDLWVPRRRY